MIDKRGRKFLAVSAKSLSSFTKAQSAPAAAIQSGTCGFDSAGSRIPPILRSIEATSLVNDETTKRRTEMLFDHIKNLLRADAEELPSSAMIRDELGRLESRRRNAATDSPNSARSAARR
jgi:hypothetical protein